ncbi:MAG: DegT/DnrJ/EryC1/StrS family aminotransferase [Lachnospiraceae bacterium]|nr:DegT/DnrJ/EryC1/StrS family aminotransferase [Lachnospiraceae bacterium]
MEFRNLKKQYKLLKSDIDAAIQDVIASARFISGPQVGELEQQLADYVGVRHCISCANGTDAITLGLMAWGIGDGDAVFVPDFTFFSSGECPAAVGATPVFVDVRPDTFNMDLESLETAIRRVIGDGRYTPRAVIAVDLFGQPAEYDRIRAICDKYNLYLLEDGAQGFGGSISMSTSDEGSRMSCSFGDISTTSFFPAKPLGCYGDGGAVFTDNDGWADLIRSYAVHGKSRDNKYDNARIGMNSRLDTIQAAILQIKLRAFIDNELDAVNKAAAYYDSALRDRCSDHIAEVAGAAGTQDHYAPYIVLPHILPDYRSSWAQYTIQLPSRSVRDGLQAHLKKNNIPSMVYYMKPMHQQDAFAHTYSAEADCPMTERLCDTVLSLPMGPYLDQAEADQVVDLINDYIRLML